MKKIMVWGMKKSQWYIKPEREMMIGKSGQVLHFRRRKQNDRMPFHHTFIIIRCNSNI